MPEQDVPFFPPATEPTTERSRGKQRLVIVLLTVAAMAALILTLGFAVPRMIPEAPGEAHPFAVAAADGSDIGTAAKPAPRSQEAVLSFDGEERYRISLGAPILDDTAAMLDAIRTHTEAMSASGEVSETEDEGVPPSGYRWARIPVQVTVLGEQPRSPGRDLDARYLDSEGTPTNILDSFPYAPEPSLGEFHDIAPGSTITGNIAVLMPERNPEAGTLSVGPIGEDLGFIYSVK